MAPGVVIARLFICVVVFVCLARIQNVLAGTCDVIAKDNGCEIDSDGTAVMCKGGSYPDGNFMHVSALVLCSMPGKYFNPHILAQFPKLYTFTLFKSSVEVLNVDFPVIPQLKILNFTHNHITYVRPSVFRKLDSLTILDLRFNSLRSFDPEVVSNLKTIENVFLYDHSELSESILKGNQWECDKKLLWIVGNSSVRALIADADQLVCLSFKDKPVLAVMQIIQTLESECQEISDRCVCSLAHVVRIGGTLRPMITVDCSNKNLKTLPANLPSFTSTLMMNGNQITDISPLKNDEKYRNLLSVFLDYNNISSIDILKNSSFLSTFSALSLSGNKLSQVPVDALEQGFETNPNIARVALGQNPWRCDCEYTPIFRDFLAKYRAVIKDIGNVTCSYRPNDDKSLLPILSLSRRKLCQLPWKFKISTLDAANVCMSILLAVILLDFAYNYYMYKRYSKLPWIAKRLP